MYNEIVVPLALVSAVFVTIMNIIFMGLALHIEGLPCKTKVSGHSWSRPFPTSVIVTISSLVVYIVSFYSAISDNVIWFVLGLAGMCAVLLLVITSLTFSYAVIGAINAKNKAGVIG